MAERYVPATLDDNGYRRGLAAQENGMYVDTLSQGYENEKDWQRNQIGGRVGFVDNYDPGTTISVSGEVEDTTAGIMLVVFGTAHSFTASVLHGDEFGITAGGHYLENASIEQGRDQKKTLSADFVSAEGLA